MINAVSTPIREKPEQWQGQFDEVTPIKANDIDENDGDGFEFDNLFDNLASDSSLFGEGKRKCTLTYDGNNSRLRDASPDLRLLKKQKRDETKTISSSNKSIKFNGKNELLTNVTPGADMFEEDMFLNSQNTPCKSVGDNTIRICPANVKITNENCMEHILKDDIDDNEFINLSILEKLGRSMELNTKVKSSFSEERDSNGDLNILNVSVKENAVVHTILNAMEIDSETISKEDCEINAEINTAPMGFSQILLESVLNWEKKSDFKEEEDLKFDDKLKKKLAGNVNNMKIIKHETSGWSQMDGFSNILEDTIFQNSQYQELGPFFGLPSKVQKLYEQHKGIKDLYHWQKECLTLKAVKERKNLVYSLPTSGGKTLVAEMLILRELLCYNRNVLFILPFVSIVQEKVHDLSIFALELGFLVEEYAAGKGVIPLRKRRKRRSVVIATIEKASAIIISLIETKQLEEFGLIVVDELHLVSEDSGRGATLESLLTQVLHVGEKIQIIGMTATIGNLPEIAKFLRAESYTGSFRPVELQEYVKCGNDVFTVNWNAEEILQPIRTVKSPSSDPDGISELVLEIVPKDSVLVFCPTKKNCENVALLITEVMPRELQSYKEAEKASFLNALRTETNGQICPVMKKTIPFGVVYHHSGLTPGERKLLEEAFRTGTLSVICCTSTLAAGVNLPAARVLLRSPYIGKDFISLSKYKQMIGRAGRAGMGCKGESYLICQSSDCAKVARLLTSKMDDAMSKMNLESLKSLILSSVGLGIATTRGQLRNLVQCTLLSVQAEKLNVDIKKMIDLCISGLFKMGAIRVKEFEIIKEEDGTNSKLDITIKRSENRNLRITNSSELSVSRLGRAATKGCIGLERAHELYGDLIKAQSALVLLTELHLLYLVTPYEMLDQIKPNYSVYFNVYMQLSAKEIPAAKTIGITEFVISKLAIGMKPKNIPESILNRFYIALMLNEMLKQQNIWDVSKLFQVSAGLVQTLMTQTSTFANNLLRFSEELSELWSFRSLLNEFAPRLAHCCSPELLPLMQLPAVKRGRAKQLYDAGFKTLNAVATADASNMVKSVDHLPKRVAEQIIAAARLLLLEKAENLKEEAEEVLLGLAEKIVSK